MYIISLSIKSLSVLDMSPARLPDHLVRLIYVQHDEGKSNRSIASNLRITEKGVRSALRRRLCDSSSLQQKKVKLGRPRCTSIKTDSAIAIHMKRNRFKSNESIATSFNVSRDTVRRRGMEYNLFSRMAHTDYLKKHHKIARRRWFMGHKNTNFQSWLFPDEVLFQLQDCSAPQRLYVHRKRNEKYVSSCVLPKPISDRRSLMVWAIITSTGKGPIRFVDESITAAKYTEILQKSLIPYLENVPLAAWKHLIFQHDNARPHTARSTLSFLQKQCIQTATWPALSPDLNPIENV